MTLHMSKIVGNLFTIVPLFSVIIVTFLQSASGYLDVNQYCRAFDVNFKPIICIIKNSTASHPPPNYNPSYPPSPPPTQYPILYPQRPPPPDYIDYSDDDDECSCDITCFPRIINQRSFMPNSLRKKRRNKRTPSTSYRCKSCGSSCPVDTRPATCNCAIPASKAECTCTATCAAFRYGHSYFVQRDDDDDDAQCILSVTALEDWRLGEERPPYLCECKRSKDAENTSRPDFICICQRITRD